MECLSRRPAFLGTTADTSSLAAGAWNSIVKAVSKFFKKPPVALLQLFDVQAVLRDPGMTPEEMLQAKPAAIPSWAAVLEAGRQDPHLQLQAELFRKRFELQADLMSELYVSCCAWGSSALGMQKLWASICHAQQLCY